MAIVEINRRGTTIEFKGSLHVTTCWCGTVHAIPEELWSYVQRQHAQGSKYSVYCPLGHQWVPSGVPESTRLKEQIAAEQRIASQRLAALERERRSHAATKGKLTKTRNRIANGVCPCCNRHFANVERHMKNQHPDFPQPVGTQP